MAEDTYEYTDAKGGVHRVHDLNQVPKDRLRHMLVIGGEDAPPVQGAQGAVRAAPAKAGAPLFTKTLGPEVWAVSGALFLVGVFSKKFLLRVFCVGMAVVWLLYSSWDVFLASGFAKTEEQAPKPRAAAPRADEN